MQKIFVVLLYFFTLASASCGDFSLACKVKMNKEYIESSCGLVNGVRFEELKVLKFDSANFPSSYQVTFSIWCYNPGFDGVQTFWPDRLYFNKPNGHYLWRIDSTTNGVYQRRGLYRERTDITEQAPDVVEITDSSERREFIDSISKVTRVPDPNSSSVCPVKFKQDTWYFLNFNDQRYHAYLYIDKKMKFEIHKESLPTNF